MAGEEPHIEADLSAAHDEDDLIEKLMRKISIQATQLGDLSTAFNGSAEYVELCEDRIMELESTATLTFEVREEITKQNISEAASRRRDYNEMATKLDETERLLTLSYNQISDLEGKLRAKERQCKLNDKKILELSRETQKMRLQIESFHHKTRLQPTESNSARKIVSRLKNEVDTLKAYLINYQTRLEASKKAERILTLKVSDLEEFRDSQSGPYMELETKAQVLTAKVRQLTIELQIEREKISLPLISIPSNSFEIKKCTDAFGTVALKNHSEVDHTPRSAMRNYTSDSGSDEMISALECTIMTMQLKLDEIEKRGQETHDTLGDNGIPERLKETEEERDVLLEFIQGDMRKSADISQELLRVRDRAEVLENDLRTIQSKEKLLHTEISNLRLRLLENRHSLIEGDNEDYIVSMLSNELRSARARLQELESGLKELDVTEDCDRSIQSTIISVSTPKRLYSIFSPSSIDPKGSLPLLVTSPSASTSIPASIATVNQPWMTMTSSDLDSRHAQAAWTLERAELMRELNAIRPVDRALAELADDLKKLKENDNYQDLFDDTDRCTPPYAALTNEGIVADRSISNYSHMYSKRSAATAGIIKSGKAKGKGRSNSFENSNSAVSRDLTCNLSRICMPIKPLHPLCRTQAGSERGTIEQLSRPHGMLSQQHSWVGLPSIARLSVPLDERIKKLLLDLHRSETDYSELNRRLVSIQNSSKLSDIATEKNIQDLMSAAETAEKARRHSEDILKRRESDLKAERGAITVMDSTLDVLCGVPGGWEEFFDRDTLKLLQPARREKITLKTMSSNPSVRTLGDDCTIASSLNSSWDIKKDVCSPSEYHLDLSMRGNMGLNGGTSYGSSRREYMNNSKSEKASSLNSSTASSGIISVDEGFRAEGHHDANKSSPVLIGNLKRHSQENNLMISSRERGENPTFIPPTFDMLPLIMSRAVAMIVALTSELRLSQREESSTHTQFNNCQNKLKSREIEYEKLTAHIHGLEQRSKSREQAFMHIESGMKKDLDLARFHANEQSIMVAELGSKLKLISHSNHGDTQQLLRRQKEANDKQELCNVLREYGYNEILDALTLSWSDITECTRNVLHDIVQSFQRYTKDRSHRQTRASSSSLSSSSSLGSTRPASTGRVTSRTSTPTSALTPPSQFKSGRRSKGRLTSSSPCPPLSSTAHTPSPDGSLDDMDSVMTPTTEASDSYEDSDENDIEENNGHIQIDGMNKEDVEEEGSESSSYGNCEIKSGIGNRRHRRHHEVQSAISPLSSSGLELGSRVASSMRQAPSDVLSMSPSPFTMQSPGSNRVVNRHRRCQDVLVSNLNDISPSVQSLSHSAAAPPLSLRYCRGSGDGGSKIIGVCSDADSTPSPPPNNITEGGSYKCPSEVLNFRLSKAKQMFASMREDLRLDFEGN